MFVMLCYFNAFGDKITFLFLFLQIFSELFLIAADILSSQTPIVKNSEMSPEADLYAPTYLDCFFKISAAIAANHHINLIFSTYHSGRYFMNFLNEFYYHHK